MSDELNIVGLSSYDIDRACERSDGPMASQCQSCGEDLRVERARSGRRRPAKCWSCGTVAEPGQVEHARNFNMKDCFDRRKARPKIR